MIWKKKPSAEYLKQQFSRFIPLMDEQTRTLTQEAAGGDVFHEHVFVFCFIAAAATKMNINNGSIIDFSTSAAHDIMGAHPGLKLEVLYRYSNYCQNILAGQNMSFAEASADYYDAIARIGHEFCLNKEDYQKVVCSACAAFLMILERDGYSF